jgi:predicted type IV restriction endonuclease
MKVERKISDFSAEKQKQNENMETKTEICRTETETEFFLIEVETEMERSFPAEHVRKRKFPFTNTEFPFYGCFAWPI